MMLIKLIFLVIVSEARIQVSVNVGTNKSKTKIYFSGEDDKLVSNKEITLFNITKENLIKGIEVELGRKPNDIFVRDPTPYKNLFKQFKWQQVTRNLIVIEAKVIDVIKEKGNFKIINIINNSSSNSKVNVDFVDKVECTALSYWSEDGLPFDEIYYNVSMKFDISWFKYENKWRNTTIKTGFLPFGIRRDDYFIQKPGQNIKVNITAFKTILVLKLKFLAKLKGDVIGDYNRLFGKYHFWAPTINNVMIAGNIRNEIVTTEFIEVRCFTEPNISIIEVATGKNVPTFRPKGFSFRNKY